jgi:ABC-2 type transport system permease protein
MSSPMNKNLFIKELKRNAIGLILWSAIIMLLISVTMSVFRTFLENQSKVMGLLNIIPGGLLEFKGISDVNALLSVMGFYSANNIIYMMVLGSIYSIVLSSNILLKEEYNKTAEYLLTRPLTRTEIFLSKSAVISVNILLINLGTSLAGFVSIELVKNTPFSLGTFLILSLYTFLLNFLFGTIGLLMSTGVKRARPITTLSIGFVLVIYFAYTLSKIANSVSWVGYLTPFKYVNTNVTDPNYHLEIRNLAFFVLLSVIFMTISYKLYKKKDIYT